MESLAYLWRDYEISIRHNLSRIDAEHFQPILNSPTILQCRKLHMTNALFSFKDFKVLYTVKIIESLHNDKENVEVWQQYWQQFLEHPGVKAVVVFQYFYTENFDIFDRLSKDFSTAVVPNAFKVVFVRAPCHKLLTEFVKTNKTSGEKLELKQGLPVECRNENYEGWVNYVGALYSLI
ncbi:hypothetical protein DdX_09826 [Ditylenchus destructor]|uniref:Uncharacterized protein n=1 Tax=Ditylenchus destructor TaxID=166010 RepID=A0AAD4N1U5_9BILA|nr:hypothetical protein DdX_09826 [Ditylenchus destructor]